MTTLSCVLSRFRRFGGTVWRWIRWYPRRDSNSMRTQNLTVTRSLGFHKRRRNSWFAVPRGVGKIFPPTHRDYQIFSAKILYLPFLLLAVCALENSFLRFGDVSHPAGRLSQWKWHLHFVVAPPQKVSWPTSRTQKDMEIIYKEQQFLRLHGLASELFRFQSCDVLFLSAVTKSRCEFFQADDPFVLFKSKKSLVCLLD